MAKVTRFEAHSHAGDKGVSTGRRARVAGTMTGTWRATGTVMALVSAILLIVFALFPAAIAPYSPLDIDPMNAFAPPNTAHFLGTDESGRDVYSRIIFGARESLTIGLVATAVALTIGTTLGGLAGGSRGRLLAPVRFVSDRVIEALFAFPSLLLALLIIAVRGPGVVSVVVAVAVSTIPGFARMVRGGVRRALTSGAVETSILQGDGAARTWVTLVLPDALRPIVVLATLGIGHAVILAGALGFLGLGAPPPTPEWGAMLNAGRPYLGQAWWLTVAPGGMILFTGLTATVLGRALDQRRHAS